MCMRSSTNPFQTGMIMLWSGSVATVPGGWALCNGSNGTPDLRNKFIVGAGSTYNPAATGGDTAHYHTFTSDQHNHQIGAGFGLGGGLDYLNATSPETVPGTTNSGNNLPPYYALCYIMKL